jgi:hypothetical protein
MVYGDQLFDFSRGEPQASVWTWTVAGEISGDHIHGHVLKAKSAPTDHEAAAAGCDDDEVGIEGKTRPGLRSWVGTSCGRPGTDERGRQDVAGSEMLH